jgi:hypothetical protein
MEVVRTKLLGNVYGDIARYLDCHIVNNIAIRGPEFLEWCVLRDELYRHCDPSILSSDPLYYLEGIDSWAAYACRRMISDPPLAGAGFAAIADLWRHCGGWSAYSHAALFVERPIRLCLDAGGRPHSHDGMAVEYRDGAGVYMWHGVSVPKKVILSPETLSPLEIVHERNTEVRRIMIERYGLDRLLAATRSKCLDVDQEGRRALHRLRLSGDEPIVAVKVRCPSTGQIYFLRVPPTMRTCRDAVAWTFGFEKPEEYQPIAET